MASTHRIAIRLKAPDPAARTALLALARVMPGECPARLHRYDLWEIDLESGGMEVVDAVLGRYPDILNPNKQERLVLGEGLLPGEDPDMTWASVEVCDEGSSSSAGWTAVVRQAGFPVSAVRTKVLWRLGYPGGTPRESAREMASAVSLSVTRARGLLSNPVSQSTRILLPDSEAPRGRTAR